MMQRHHKHVQRLVQQEMDAIDKLIEHNLRTEVKVKCPNEFCKKEFSKGCLYYYKHLNECPYKKISSTKSEDLGDRL